MPRAMRSNAGAKLRKPIRSWFGAQTFYLDHAKRGRDAKLAHNTYVVEVEGITPEHPGYAIRLHHTNIVTFYLDGTVKLNSGGYHTVTTKARMNEILQPLGLTIGQKKFNWYVYEIGQWDKPVEFFDGMMVRVEQSGMDVRAKLHGNPQRFGKFEGSGDFGEAVYELVMDASYLDEEVGSSDELGWYGLALGLDVPGFPGKHNVIVTETSSGFFDVTEYDTPEQARKDWRKVEREYEKFYASGESED